MIDWILYGSEVGRREGKRRRPCGNVSYKLGEWGAGELKLSYTRVLVQQDGTRRLAAAQVAPSGALPDPTATVQRKGES